jgi:DNA repair exonuclease SbcCD ATPase subunit
MFNPITAAIGIAISVFGNFKEALQATQKALDELANSPSASAEWIDKQRDAAEKAAVSNNVWEDSLRKVADSTEAVREKTDELLTRQREVIHAENEIAQAQKGLDEARLELAEKLGQITPLQAIKIRLEIDDAAFKQQAETKIKEIEAEINARTREAAQDRGNANDIAQKVTATDAAARAAEQAKIRNDGKLAQDQKNLELSQANQAKAEKVIEDLEGKGIWGGEYDETDPQYYALKAARDTVTAETAVQILKGDPPL